MASKETYPRTAEFESDLRLCGIDPTVGAAAVALSVLLEYEHGTAEANDAFDQDVSDRLNRDQALRAYRSVLFDFILYANEQKGGA